MSPVTKSPTPTTASWVKLSSNDGPKVSPTRTAGIVPMTSMISKRRPELPDFPGVSPSQEELDLGAKINQYRQQCS